MMRNFELRTSKFERRNELALVFFIEEAGQAQVPWFEVRTSNFEVEQGFRDESQSVREADLRQVQDRAPARRRARDLSESEAQAAAGIERCWVLGARC
jgi:hypothetical protein